MLEIYQKLSTILDKREKRLAFYVLLLTIVVAVVEVLGVASIMPFMAILANPEIIKTNSILAYVYNLFEFKNNESFLFFVGISVLVMLVGSTALRASIVWVHVYYANLRSYSISSRLLTGYLKKPYQWFLLRNSSEIATTILSQVSRVVHGTLYPILRLITNVFIAVLILSLFILADPTLAVSIALFLGVTYGAIFKFASKHLAKYGEAMSVLQNKRLKAVQEAFGGIKDVKIYGLERSFREKYQIPARNLAFNSVSIKMWAEMPSFGMQALVFGGMMVMILYLMKTRGDLENAIPVLAMYALGGYKLMPSLQEIYKQLAEIKANKSALNKIYNDFLTMDFSTPSNTDISETPLGINRYIELQNLQFTYPEANNIALDNINIKIEKNSTVGFVGGSGSGKTTTIDIILGLLQPEHGNVFVDDHSINKNNLRSWQRTLGYVPQQIYLTDDSIAANIAFGIPKNEIDKIAVEKAARIANIHDFIVNELPEGYDTLVGERGVRLSGGQKQRIGIARAIYNDPDVLILDEATSALDNITEKAVMDAVNKLGHKKTIIIVAHRLSTVQPCDKLFLFEKGKIAAIGTYNELINTSSIFKEMANIQK